MDLTTAKCPECGADLKITPGQDVVVCEYCGANVIVKNLVGTGSSTQNLLTLANSSLSGHSYKEAYDYFNKVLENDSTNSESWFGKGICAGALTHINDIRFGEMVVCFENAVKNSPPEKQEETRKKVALEINKAVMSMVSNFKGGGELLFNPREGGGFSISIGNILYDAKHLADESLKAMETANEWFPGNGEISNNLNNLKQMIGKFGPMINRPNFNLPQSNIGTTRRKSSHGFIKFIFFLVIVIGGYLIVKDYVLRDKIINNVISELKNEEKTKPSYSISNINSQNGKAYISIFTKATSDKDLNEINKEVMNNYKSKYKMMYVNYFSDENLGAKNPNLQSKHNKEWIISHASSMNLIATMEYDDNKGTSIFYKYLNGTTSDINQTK